MICLYVVVTQSMLYFLFWLLLLFICLFVYLFNSCSGGTDLSEPASGSWVGVGVDSAS